MKKATFIWVAIVLRFIFASVFYHPDIKSQHFHASLTSDGVVNIYEYLKSNKDALPYTDTFNYPPLTYFFLGSWQQVVKLITGDGLHDWLWDWGEKPLYNTNLFSYLLLLKLPYLVADITILFVALRLLPNAASKNRFTYLWLLNPISLYVIYMVGQFDIVPTLLTLVSLFSFTRSKYFLTGLMLGLGAAFKTYPLLLVPVFILARFNLKTSMTIILGTMCGWLGPNIWFLSSSAYQQSVLQSSLASRLFALKLIHIPLYIPFYLGILLAVFTQKSKIVLAAVFAVCISVVVFTNFHAQWLMWSLPFGLMLCAKYKALILYVFPIYAVAMGMILLLPDQYVLVGLFTPLNPYLATVPPISSFIKSTSWSVYFQYILILLSIIIFIRSDKYEKTT